MEESTVTFINNAVFIYNESLLALWAAGYERIPIKIHTAIAVQHNYAMVVAVHMKVANTHPE